MQFRIEWRDIYVEADAFKSQGSKWDLTYLLSKYTLDKDGKPFKKAHLAKMGLLSLQAMWRKIKPLEFGRWPIT